MRRVARTSVTRWAVSAAGVCLFLLQTDCYNVANIIHTHHTGMSKQRHFIQTKFPWDPSQLFNYCKYTVVGSIPDVTGCFNCHNPFSRTMALGLLTQPLTEMSTRNLPVGKGRPARKSDNLTTICEPLG
jgi:hypothetical protein